MKKIKRNPRRSKQEMSRPASGELVLSQVGAPIRPLRRSSVGRKLGL